MKKGRYYIANFSSCSMKSSLASLSGNILRNTDRIFEVFQIYGDETHGQSPRRILRNITQNNETVFGPKESRGSTSREEESSRALSSPVKSESSSATSKKQLSFTDKLDEASESSNIADETAAACQESVKSCEKVETVSRSGGKDPLVTFATEELESKEPEVTSKSAQNIKDLIAENSAQIKSISIIRQLEEIGVEIDIDLLPNPDKKLLDDTEPGSSSTGKTQIPGEVDRKGSSPSNSDSKSPGKSRIKNKSYMMVDYSDSSILEFLAERLLSTLSCRKKYMKQIYDYFQKFKKDVNVFSNTLINIKLVVELLPMMKEKYFTQDLVKLRSNLISEAEKMLATVGSLMNEVDNDIAVWEKCIEQLDDFDQKYGKLLSTKSASILNFSELKRLESLMKDECAKADGTVILKDGRREILVKHSSDFGCLMRNFVKFLIITEILMPRMMTEEVKEK